jgi:hypothetical protein
VVVEAAGIADTDDRHLHPQGGTPLLLGAAQKSNLEEKGECPLFDCRENHGRSRYHLGSDWGTP